MTETPHDVMILIPAAGSSSRMRGADKLTQSVGGVPMLRRQAMVALATGASVVVTLPPGDAPQHAARLAALADLPVRRRDVPDAAEGLSASLRAGIAEAGPETRAVMILLADLPEIETGDLRAMIAAFRDGPDAPVLRATTPEGTPGHPVILPRRLFGQIAALAGDAGARALLKAEAARGRVRPVPLPGQRAVTDLDTPEAWAEWRRRTALREKDQGGSM